VSDVLTLAQAEDLAARTLVAINDEHEMIYDGASLRHDADRERVASDLAGLREHQSCGRAERGVWVTTCIAGLCPDARRYADNLRRTADLYGVV
jgi:hypothetical protein